MISEEKNNSFNNSFKNSSFNDLLEEKGSTTKNVLVLASRKSLLAMRQSEIVKEKLEKLLQEPGNKLFINFFIQIKKFSTHADSSSGPLLVPVNHPLAEGAAPVAITNTSLLSKSEGSQAQGVFVKELEAALLKNEAHFAVHSLKDMPFKQPKGLAIIAYLPRDDVRDVAIFNNDNTLQTLAEGSLVGTSSLRRIMLLKKKYPHLRFQGIRGNVQARIKKLQSGNFSAIVLAAAGLQRLGLQPEYCEMLSTKVLPPAPGQGIIAVEVKTADVKLKKLLLKLNCNTAMLCAQAERRAMQALQTGCTLPFAAYATLTQGVMKLDLAMAKFKTNRIKWVSVFLEVSSSREANVLGRLAANAMKKKMRRG